MPSRLLSWEDGEELTRTGNDGLGPRVSYNSSLRLSAKDGSLYKCLLLSAPGWESWEMTVPTKPGDTFRAFASLNRNSSSVVGFGRVRLISANDSSLVQPMIYMTSNSIGTWVDSGNFSVSWSGNTRVVVEVHQNPSSFQDMVFGVDALTWIRSPYDAVGVANQGDINEGVPTGTQASNLVVEAHYATDGDPNNSANRLSYAVTSNSQNFSAVTYSGATAKVAAIAAGSGTLNYETQSTHQVGVSAQFTLTDGTVSRGAQSTFQINVADVRPTAPADTDGSPSPGANNLVREGAPTGTSVGVTLLSTDPNGPAVKYELTESAQGRFQVDEITGIVTVANGSLLNIEDSGSFIIRARAFTTANNSSTRLYGPEAEFVISLLDERPTAPVDSNGSTNNVTENVATGTSVGITLSSTDPNGPAPRYELTDSAGGRFKVDATTGVISVDNAALINYEVSPSHTIRARAYTIASDGSTRLPGAESTFTITVSDVTPTAPADTDGGTTPSTNNQVAEGGITGTPIGIILTSTDPNGPAPRYELTDTAGGRFKVDATSGVISVDNAALINYEVSPSHTIRARAYTIASDGSTRLPGAESTFTINVKDVTPTTPADNDGGTTPSTNNQVTEGAATGTPIGITLNSTDPNGPAPRYELTDTAEGRFKVDPTSGVISMDDAALINYEVNQTHTIKARAYTIASDGSTKLPGAESTFTINVIDVVQSPPLDTDPVINSVAEGVAAGTPVGITLLSSDPNGAPIQYELTDNAGGRFTVDPTTGVVTVSNPGLLNHETAWSHTITARAIVTLAGAEPVFSDLASYTISITDVLSTAPVDVDPTANRITEGASVGTTVGITASSTDIHGGGIQGSIGNDVYYRLSDDAGGRFAIDTDSGVVTLARPDLISFDLATSHSITVVPYVTRSDSTEINGAPTTLTIDVQLKANPDLQIRSATASGGNTLVIEYDVLNRTFDSGSVILGMALSSDATFNAGQDQVLSRFTLSGADLTLGAHTKSITIGSAAGNLPLPGAGLADPDIDYRLLAVLDPDATIDERQLAADGKTSLASKSNNAVPFAGSYHVGPGPLMIHGTDSADSLTMTGTSTLSVTFRGATRTYTTSQVTSVRMRMNDGNETLSFPTLTVPMFIAGGAGQDSITSGTGNDTLIGGPGNDALAGGSGNDRYSFDADSPLGSDVLTDSAGIDTLDFSATTGVGNTVRLGDAVAQVVNSNLTIQLNSASAFENVTGGQAADALYGNSLANRIEGLAGNDLLSGGTGNDIYVFVADSQLGTDTVVEASTNGTADLLDFDGTTANLTVDLAVATEQVVNANLRLILSQGATIENVSGGAGDDNLYGNLLANRLEGRAGNDLLVGREAADTYAFAVNTPLGTDTLTEVSTGGVDTLDFSGTVSEGLTVDLAQAATQAVSPRLSIYLGGSDLFENVLGGNGADTLRGNALANSLTGNGGYDLLIGLDGNDTLNGNVGGNRLEGGTGNDTYILDADLPLGANTLIEAEGEGTDTLNFSLTTLLGLTLDLGQTGDQVVTTAANTRVALNSSTAFENLVGGSQNDSLIGNTAANDIKGGPGNDTIRPGAGNDRVDGGTGDDLLQGGSGDDTYAFPVTASQNLGNDVVQEEIGGGIDLLDFSGATTAVQVDLASVSTQQVALLHRLTLQSGAVIEQVSGGTGNDILSGNALDNLLIGNAGIDVLYGQAGSDTLNGGAGDDDLQGGEGGDRYLFTATSALGKDTLTESSTASGTDLLDFTGTTLAVTLDLSTAVAQAVNANLSLVLGSATSIEAAMGGSGNDTLRGNVLANTLDGGLGNDILIATDGQDLLRGGAGNDSYQFRSDLTSASVTIDEAGGGTDLLDFSLYTLEGIRVDLAKSTSQASTSRVQLTLANSATATSTGIENVTGTTLADELLGNELTNVILGGDGADTLSGRGANDTLNGGLGNDTYTFDADSALGVDTLVETGTDTDTLDFTQTTAAVTANLGLATSQVVNSSLSLLLGSTSLFENITGGDGADVLTGNASANRLLGGPGNDRLTGAGGDDVLDGGAGDDVYAFAGTTSLGTDSLFDNAGIDTLDFSQSTQAVNVSLSSTSQQPVNSLLQLKLDSAIQFEIIIGSPLNDMLLGNALGNVLFGGAGADILMGYSGRDILIGGSGTDDLFGGADEDIVMDGSWQMFSESTRVAQLTRIADVSRDWLGAGTYAERVLRLRNSANPINATTVTLDTGFDRISGEDGLDWFWIGTNDLNDRQPFPDEEVLR